MRALELARQAPIATRPLRLVERPEPVPGPGEVRVRVRVSALCRTDLHVIEGDLAAARLPLVPGHQVVGIVDALGPGAGRFALGERIGIPWLRSTCGRCPACQRGDENLCPQSRYTGWHEDGGHAEAAVVPEAYAYRIPDALSDEQAAPLLCAGIIGHRALARSEVRPGDRIGIWGFGSSAHVTAQLARARGCTLYVTTRGEAHRALARELGAAWVGDGSEPPPVLLDGAILFAPAGALVPPALRALRPGGTLAIAGIHLSPVPELTYGPHLFHEKRLTSVEANTRGDGEELFAEAAKAGVRSRVVLYPLAQGGEALLALARDQITGTALLVP